MRLVEIGGKLVVQFTMTWEAAYLAERGDCWVPFCLPGKTEAIGEIHASTHEVRLLTDHPLTRRQAVTLCAPRREERPDTSS